MADSQTINVRPPVWALLTAVVVGGLFYIGGKKIEYHNPNPSTITVSGEGKMNAVPDIAQMTFGVRVERARTSQEAMQKLSSQMTAVMDAVVKTGIDKKDISSEQFSLNPAYDWSNGDQRLRGYDAQQMLRVKVRNLDKTAEVLGAATGAGANQAGDIQFTIDDPENLRVQARTEAIEEARQKAAVLAKQLDVRLVELKGYGEDGGGYYPPTPYAYGRGGADMAVAEQAAPPLPAGQQEVTVRVNLTYEVE